MKYRNVTILAATGIVVLLLISGCSQSYLGQGRSALDEGRYDSAANYLKLALQKDPNNPEVLKALGRLQYHQGKIEEAKQNLRTAQTVLTDDPQIDLYLGFCAEKEGNFTDAANAYERFLAEKPGSRVSEQVRGRLLYVKNESIRAQVSQAVASESSIAQAEPKPLTVAVLPFLVGEGADDRLKAVADGLAATLWYDLATIKELTLVERLQVNYLLQELEVAQEGLTSEGTAPRVGKIVSAGQLVNASLNSPSENRLSLDAALVQTTTSEYKPTYNSANEFKKVLELQKEMTLAILDSLGIDLKGTRRRNLAKSPTDSYDAFVAFGRGVQQYDQGNYLDAKQFFDEARNIDPRFGLATQFANDSQLLMSNTMNLEQFDSMILANIEAITGAATNLMEEVRAIGAPDTNPRIEDEPSEGRSTATVSGEVR